MGSRAAPHRSTTASSSARVEHLVHGDRAAASDRRDARARHHGSGQHVVLPGLSFTDPCTIGRDPPPSIHRSPAVRGELRQARDTRRSGADGSAVRRPTGVSARRSPAHPRLEGTAQFVRSAESVDDPEVSAEAHRRRFARPLRGRRGAAPPLALSGLTTFERTVLSVTRSIAAGETRPDNWLEQCAERVPAGCQISWSGASRAR